MIMMNKISRGVALVCFDLLVELDQRMRMEMSGKNRKLLSVKAVTEAENDYYTVSYNILNIFLAPPDYHEHSDALQDQSELAVLCQHRTKEGRKRNNLIII